MSPIPSSGVYPVYPVDVLPLFPDPRVPLFCPATTPAVINNDTERRKQTVEVTFQFSLNFFLILFGVEKVSSLLSSNGLIGANEASSIILPSSSAYTDVSAFGAWDRTFISSRGSRGGDLG